MSQASVGKSSKLVKSIPSTSHHEINGTEEEPQENQKNKKSKNSKGPPATKASHLFVPGEVPIAEIDETQPLSLGGTEGLSKIMASLSQMRPPSVDNSDDESDEESEEGVDSPPNGSVKLPRANQKLSREHFLKELQQRASSPEDTESEEEEENPEESPKKKHKKKYATVFDRKKKNNEKSSLRVKQKSKAKVPGTLKPIKSEDAEGIFSKIQKAGSYRIKNKTAASVRLPSSKKAPIPSFDKPGGKPETNRHTNMDMSSANTFEFFKMLQKNQSEENPSSDVKEAEVNDPDYDPLTCPLIASYAVDEELNKAGLIRSKKTPNGKDKKHQMEDAHVTLYPFAEFKDVALFCVFDGHAGKECSTELTKLFPKILGHYWGKQNKDRKLTDITKLLTETYREVDEGLKKFEYEGSTATSVVIWRSYDGKRHLQCANLGDSSAYILREGKSVCLTQDHKPSCPSERKRIEECGTKLEQAANRLPGGLAVSRAFGDHYAKSMEPALISVPTVSKPIEISPKDTRLIIASDGIWDVMNGQKAFDSIKTHRDTKTAANILVKLAVKNSSCTDNVTAIVINLR